MVPTRSAWALTAKSSVMSLSSPWVAFYGTQSPTNRQGWWLFIRFVNPPQRTNVPDLEGREWKVEFRIPRIAGIEILDPKS